MADTGICSHCLQRVPVRETDGKLVAHIRPGKGRGSVKIQTGHCPGSNTATIAAKVK